MPLFIAFFLAAFVYLHNDVSIDFSDEGFLWYGAQHVLTGQVPLRDFQSYDPGRYYWCAAVLSVLGKGLMPLRLAMSLFQFVALCFGLLTLRRVSRSALFLLGAGFLAIFWMLIPFRYFDASMAMIALFFATRLVEKQSFRRHLAAGVFIGLATFFGINHGLYLFAGFFVLILYLDFKGIVAFAAKKRLFFFLGLALGLFPFWWMFLTIPGFWASKWESMAMIGSSFYGGKMNVSYPISWPWVLHWDKLTGPLPNFSAKILEYTNYFSIGLLYIFLVAYYLVCVPALIGLKNIQERSRALFVASIFVGLFYLRHIFARGDVCYLGEGIFPVWAGLLASRAFLRSRSLKITHSILVVFFVVNSFISAALLNNIIFKYMVPKGGMIWYRVGKDRLWLTHPDAEYCENVKKLVSKYVKPEEPILLAPLLTTFYCLLNKESPVHELYFCIAPTPAMEERSVQDLENKKVRWAIVANLIVDGHKEHGLSNSHPILWKYLMKNFEFVTNEGLRPSYFLMRRKSSL